MKRKVFKKNILMVSLMVALTLCAGRLFAQDNRIDDGLVEKYKNALLPKPGIRGCRLKDVTGDPNLVMNLNFKLNSFELEPQEVKYLNALGQALQDSSLRKYVYRVEGYTCNLGGDEYNRDLSYKRAQAVVDYIIQTFQFSRAQFKVEGFGMNNPIAPNTTEEGRKKNRRVVIINTLKEFEWTSEIERPEILVKAKYARGKEERELAQGATLTSRDNYCVEFTSKAAAYVYIYQVTPSTGSHDLLFPNIKYSKITNPVEPGRVIRVPDFGNWFYLDDNKGKEHIVVIGKNEELKDPVKVCDKVLAPSGSGYTETASNTTPPRAPRGVLGKRERSVQGIREDPPLSPPEDERQEGLEKLFTWKLSFLHQ